MVTPSTSAPLVSAIKSGEVRPCPADSVQVDRSVPAGSLLHDEEESQPSLASTCSKDSVRRQRPETQ